MFLLVWFWWEYDNSSYNRVQFKQTETNFEWSDIKITDLKKKTNTSNSHSFSESTNNAPKTASLSCVYNSKWKGSRNKDQHMYIKSIFQSFKQLRRHTYIPCRWSGLLFLHRPKKNNAQILSSNKKSRKYLKSYHFFD